MAGHPYKFETEIKINNQHPDPRYAVVDSEPDGIRLALAADFLKPLFADDHISRVPVTIHSKIDRPCKFVGFEVGTCHDEGEFTYNIRLYPKMAANLNVHSSKAEQTIDPASLSWSDEMTIDFPDLHEKSPLKFVTPTFSVADPFQITAAEWEHDFAHARPKCQQLIGPPDACAFFSDPRCVINQPSAKSGHFEITFQSRPSRFFSTISMVG